MAAPNPHLLKRPHADLAWRDGGPVSRSAGDIYFSAEDGLEETRSVFLAGAGFPERFNDDLTIVGELGFGTGLNFLALWQMFKRCAPARARLHVVSIEGWPLRLADAERALSAFPELAGLSSELLAAWPSAHKGAHRRIFEHGRVVLTLFHDEAALALSQMDFTADAWFLDGFAPAKNPDMWSPDLFAEIARLSKPGAPSATFTVAGAVRRGLAEAGFAVAKRPGFGRKRERLEAVFEGQAAPAGRTGFAPPQPVSGPVAIIGGGVASASLVHAFAQREREVEVFAEGGWASGASGAPAGLLTPRLEAADRPHSRALLAAFDFAAWRLRGINQLTGEGVLRCAKDAPGQDRLRRLADLLDERFSWRDAQGEAPAGLWMGGAGQFDPAAVVHALSGGRAPVDARVVSIGSRDGASVLTLQDGTVRGPYAAVIVAGGYAGAGLTPGLLEPTAGHVAVFEGQCGLDAPAAWGGYAAPLKDGGVLLGATHVKQETPTAADVAEAALRRTGDAAPVPLDLGEVRLLWGGVRAASADRLPLCGPSPGPEFGALWGEAARRGSAPDRIEAGLDGPLVLGGFGARGFAHAPLLAEHLVSLLCGEPAALEQGGLQALHPARLAWRALRRGG
jgi:tRNA 5-methylaminomethyl-2-thiouridine biosynthesis bifunctional protein